MPEKITLRPPSISLSSSPTLAALVPAPAFTPPSLSFIKGTWHVTHSTLPKWKSARNVRITYTPIARPSSSSDRRLSRTSSHDSHGPTASLPWKGRLDDLVRYQRLDSDRVKRIRGVDTPVLGGEDEQAAGSWDWRGRGMLAVASARWEVLGYGLDEIDDNRAKEDTPNQFMVTFFAPTVFTPAGMDFYSRSPKGLSPAIVAHIKELLDQLPTEELQKLAASLFEVKLDGQWQVDAEVDDQEVREGGLR
ncbi:MAG: hypothetical protein M1814_005172 [Vezdaea aestivalis]|nr:MAG: hypothetical protein M1814_005172 [Vezdaea aestivalis]